MLNPKNFIHPEVGRSFTLEITKLTIGILEDRG